MLSSQWVLLLLSLIPILNGSLLSEQHDPIAVYLQATETFSEGLVYVLRQRGVLSGWRKEMLTQVELLNNWTLEQRVNNNNQVPLWNATALEGIMEKKLIDYGYHEAVVNHGKTTSVDSPRNWTLESTLLSHEAVTRLLLASTQIEQHILRPKLRLHVKQARDQQAQQSAPNRHFVSPFQPLLYSRSNAYSVGDFVNTIDLTNKLATSLGLTMPESFLLRNRLFYTAIQPVPYASPRPHPPVKQTPNLQAGTRAQDRDEARSRETRLSQSFIVYNSRGAYTGGSTALRLLAEELTRLGHDVLFCDDKNAVPSPVHSSFEPKCLDPPLTSIVVTGEWCHAVLTEYGVKPHRGRTVQYHLGFHHDNPCNAAVPLAASHYLAAQLGSRMLGGYYLSAPMNNLVRDAFVELLLKGKMLDSGSSGTFFESGADGLGRHFELEKLVSGKSTEDILSSTVSWGHGDQKLLSVPKENIVVIDTDFSDDYPPEKPVPYTLPPGFRVVYARDMHPKDVPLLLQRAKVLLDLAMPGPERMVSEAILFGAVPVISEFWNGASEVDFPGLLRVDPHNSTSLTETLKFALLNYESLVTDPVTHGRFFSYVVSQWERHHSTSRLLASSASLHFVLVARGLDEERIAVLRAFALLFMYPWASIDIYVRDVRWFLRHHYLAATLLKRGGYLRKDVGNPQDFDITTTFLPSRGSSPEGEDSSDPGGGASLVRIQHLSFLRDCTVGKGLLDHAGVQGRESVDPPEWRLVPPWAKSVIVLTSSPDPLPSTQQTAMVFAEPLFLVELIEGYESGGLISLLPANGRGESSPAAIIMSAHRAVDLHGCPSDPWPVGPRQGRGGSPESSSLPSVLHELATGRLNDLDKDGGRSLPDPRVRVELQSNAMIDLFKAPEEGLGDVKFIDGLRDTSSWLELNSFYSQV